MRRKLVTIAAFALVMAMIVEACAGESGQTTFTGDTSEEPAYQASLNPIAPAAYADVRGLKLEKGTYISIIGKSEGTVFWKEVKSGVLQAAEDLNAELGYTGGDKIKVTYNAPARAEDIDEQVNILDEELSRYPDVIGIASIDEDACTVQFDLATENGIPIIALDSGNKYPGIQCTVKTDNQEAARTGAYKLADEIDKKGDVMVLVHDSKSETAKERVKSFQAELTENHPDVHVVEVIYCDTLDDIKKQMADEQNEGLEEGARKVEKESFSDADAVQYRIEQHPGLKGIFATNDMTTMLGLEAIKKAEQAREEKAGEEDTQENKNPSGQDQKESEKTSGQDTQESEKTSGQDTQESGKVSGENEQENGKVSGEAEQESSKVSGAVEQENGKASEVDAQKADNPAKSDNANEKDSEPVSAGEKDEPADSLSREGNPSDEGKDEGNSGTEDAENGASMRDISENRNEETTEDFEIVLMGFDVSKEQLKALETGEISGLVVQNPFGIGYASVVAAARTVLQAGNEAQVRTGYLWVTKDNMNDEAIRKMLYE